MAIVQQDRYSAVVKVSRNDVRLAIMIEVRTPQALIGTAAGSNEAAWRNEAPLAVAAEHFDLVVAPAINRGVQLAIGVEVSNHNSMRMRVGVDVNG